MSEISKAYEPQSVEDKWYQFWLDGKFFRRERTFRQARRPPSSSRRRTPGVLTMGHVLNNTIQDILCRKARMEGKEVLWLPGTDHAGIATQNAVEKSVSKKAGEIKHRDDLGRDAMVAKIWDWKENTAASSSSSSRSSARRATGRARATRWIRNYLRCVQRVCSWTSTRRA